MTEETKLEEVCYVGPRKVKSLEVQDVKTYKDTPVFKVIYEGGFNQLLTQKTFNIVKTSEPKDFNYIRDTKFESLFKEIYPLVGKHFLTYGDDMTVEQKAESRKEILKEMITLVCEYDLTVTEIENVLQTLISEANNLFSALGYQIDNAYDRASNYLWSKDDTTFVPGYDQSNDLTLIQAKVVLDSIPQPQVTEPNNDGQNTGDRTE